MKNQPSVLATIDAKIHPWAYFAGANFTPDYVNKLLVFNQTRIFVFNYFWMGMDWQEINQIIGPSDLISRSMTKELYRKAMREYRIRQLIINWEERNRNE